MGPLSKPLFHFIKLLEKENIPHTLIGGIAVTLTVSERYTKDIDFTILLDEKKAKRLENIFKKNPKYEIIQHNFISLPNIPDFFRVMYEGVAVDLLVANTDFQKVLIKRAKIIYFTKKRIRIATPEDLIILKLLADRPRDREDIQSILKHEAKLDWAYMEKWAGEWEINDRLKKIREAE